MEESSASSGCNFMHNLSGQYASGRSYDWSNTSFTANLMGYAEVGEVGTPVPFCNACFSFSAPNINFRIVAQIQPYQRYKEVIFFDSSSVRFPLLYLLHIPQFHLAFSLYSQGGQEGTARDTTSQ